MNYIIRDLSGWSAKIRYPSNPKDIFNFVLQSRTYDTNISIYDMPKLTSLVDRWYQLFPSIRPFYAVKANPDPEIISKLHSLGLGFNIASKTELELVHKAKANLKSDVIFAQLFKSHRDLLAISNLGVEYLTFDCVEELQKIADFGLKNLKMILRIEAKQEEGEVKSEIFGVVKQDFKSVFEAAARLGFNVVGIAFHMSAISKNNLSYYKALKDANEAWKIGEEFGFKLKILNIGGGFSSHSIDDAAIYVNRGINEFFADRKAEIISEPGKYFSETIVSSCFTVVGKKVRNLKYFKIANYFLSDGMLGTFAILKYDKARVPVPILLKNTENKAKIPSVFYGPTCIGGDEILRCDFEEIDIGDKLMFDNMGAYNTTLATDFNGIPMADHIKIYIDKEN